jgi:hypothetical protein
MRKNFKLLSEPRQSNPDRKKFNVDASHVGPAYWRDLIAHRNHLANRENAAEALRLSQFTLRSAKAEQIK